MDKDHAKRVLEYMQQKMDELEVQLSNPEFRFMNKLIKEIGADGLDKALQRAGFIASTFLQQIPKDDRRDLFEQWINRLYTAEFMTPGGTGKWRRE